MTKFNGQVTLVGDSVDYGMSRIDLILERPNTTLLLDISQLQKLGVASKFARAFTSTIDFMHLVDALHEFTLKYKVGIVLHKESQAFVGVSGKVASSEQVVSLTTASARAAVWWLQNPSKKYEALSTSLIAE